MWPATKMAAADEERSVEYAIATVLNNPTVLFQSRRTNDCTSILNTLVDKKDVIAVLPS